MTVLSSIFKNLEESDFEFQTYRDDKERNWDIDPLVLSVSLKDIHSKTGKLLSFDSVEVIDNINEELIAQAEDIRKYYTKKFFWKNLTDSRTLSPFRQRLCFLLESRSLVTKDRDLGIYFKTPWFYEEDMIYEEFKKTLKTTDLPNLNYKSQPVAIRLKFIKTTFGWQLKRKSKHFWFSDENNYLYGLTVEEDNPLVETFEGLINSSDSCTFITRITEDRIDNLNYYKLFKYKLIKE